MRFWSRFHSAYLYFLLVSLFWIGGCSGESGSTALAANAEPVPVIAVTQAAEALPATLAPTLAPEERVQAGPTRARLPLATNRPPTPTPEPTPDPEPLKRTTNVLILGSDRRDGMPNWRTDVIMILAMDLQIGEAAIISFPRDIYIDRIPGHSPNRINVVDYVGERDDPGGGGPRLLASILEEKLDIPIHHYIRFEFRGFEEVIDALGGVTIPVDCAVSEYYPEEDIYLRLQPGEHRLDGPQALSYVRTRRQGGDLERTRRQQRVVWALRNQLIAENVLPKIPALYATLRDSVQTDIGLISAIRYVRFALALDEDSVHGMVVSPPDMIRQGWVGRMFVFLANWDRIGSQMHTTFERPPLSETNTVGDSGDRPRCPG